MTHSDTFTWNIVIKGLVQKEFFDEAISYFHRMGFGGVRQDKFTYPLCSRPVLESGENVFEEMSVRDLVSCNAMVSGYQLVGDGLSSLVCVREMVSGGIRPDSFSFISGLEACSVEGCGRNGKEIHCHVIRNGFEMDPVGIVNRIPYILHDLRLTKDMSDSGVSYSQGMISTLELPFRDVSDSGVDYSQGRASTLELPFRVRPSQRRLVVVVDRRRPPVISGKTQKGRLFPKAFDPPVSKIHIVFEKWPQRRLDLGFKTPNLPLEFIGRASLKPSLSPNQTLTLIVCLWGLLMVAVKSGDGCVRGQRRGAWGTCWLGSGNGTGRETVRVWEPCVGSGTCVTGFAFLFQPLKLNLNEILLTSSGPFVVKLNLRCLESNILRCEVEIDSEIGKSLLTSSGPFVVKLNLHCLESNILRCEVEIGSE
ncbi:hypothetical protein F3Y22_tig00112276pilonHSYRG00034 [Hibiscus syriacus]|uniref:Pentatricopeptide repeat-containing protein n=1 Tax=Hibiscus syriacus TaxID=106335 RepID=A0A6A2XGU3_HIBSY|nr:hypothetical protein F3Y22_tig00112276pilonHSYRG00034 [Hibiscus syriacus]